MDYKGEKRRSCAVCEQEFDANSRNHGRGRHIYCGPRCRRRADNRRHYRRRNPPKSEEELTRNCIICGVSFVADSAHPKAKVCSVKCNEARMNARRRRATIEKLGDLSKECELCGTEFRANKHTYHKAKYCSRPCANRAASRKHAERKKRNYDPRLFTKEWRKAAKAAKERDEYCCRLCGSQSSRLLAHHLFHLTEDEMNDHSLDSLITLCTPCHNQIHDIRVGREGGEIVVSGKIFDFLGADKVKVIPSQ